MPLNVGEVTARLRADVSQWRGGFAEAERVSHAFSTTVAQDMAKQQRGWTALTDQVRETTGSLGKLYDAYGRLADTSQKATAEGGQAEAQLKDTGDAAAQLNNVLTGLGVNLAIFSRLLAAARSPLGLYAAGVVAVTTAVSLGTHAMRSNYEEVKRLVTLTGLSAEAADNLADSMQLLGVSSDAIGNAMFRLSAEIESGGKLLGLLGVSLEDAAGKAKVEGDIFLELRDRISDMGSASERMAAGQALFGRQSRVLAAILAMSREELKQWLAKGAEISTWTEAQQKATEAYTRRVAELGLHWNRLWLDIGTSGIPILTAFVKLLNEASAEARPPMVPLTPSEAVRAALPGLTGSGTPGGRAVERMAEEERRQAAELSAAKWEETLPLGTPGVQAPGIKELLEAEKIVAFGIQRTLQERLAALDLFAARSKAAQAEGLRDDWDVLQVELSLIAKRRDAQLQALNDELAVMAKRVNQSDADKDRERAIQLERAEITNEATVQEISTRGKIGAFERAQFMERVKLQGEALDRQETADGQIIDIREQLRVKLTSITEGELETETRLRKEATARIIAALDKIEAVTPEHLARIRALKVEAYRVEEADAKEAARRREQRERVERLEWQQEWTASTGGDELAAWAGYHDLARSLGVETRQSLENARKAIEDATVDFQVLRAEGTLAAEEIRAAWGLFRKELERLTPAEREQVERLAAIRYEAKKFGEVKAVFTDVFRSLSDGIADALTDVVMGTKKMEDAFRDLGKYLVQDFLRTVLRLVFQPIREEMAQFAMDLFASVFGGPTTARPGGLGGAGAIGVGGTGAAPSRDSGASNVVQYVRSLVGAVETWYSGGASTATAATATGGTVYTGTAGAAAGYTGAASQAYSAAFTQTLNTGGSLESAEIAGQMAANDVNVTMGASTASTGTSLGSTYTSALGTGASASTGAQVFAVIRGVIAAYNTGTRIAEVAKAQGYSNIEKAVLAMDEAWAGVAEWYTFGISRFITNEIGARTFFKPSIPHEVREAWELQRTLGQAAGFQGAIGGAKTFPELYRTLLAYQSGYVGGTSPLAIGVGVRGVPAGMMTPTTGGAIWEPGADVGIGQVNPYYPTLSQRAFFELVRERPQDVYAGIQAGVTPSSLTAANTALAQAIVAKVKQLDDLTAAINNALNELLKDVIQPATLQEEIEQSTDALKEFLDVITDEADRQIGAARRWMQGLTDPVEILQQVDVVKRLIQDRYDTEVDVVRGYVAEIDKSLASWRGISAAVADQVAALTQGSFGPTDPSEAYASARGRYGEALTAFRAGRAPEQAQVLMALVDPLLQAAAGVWTRPSPQYQSLLQEVIGNLGEAQEEAARVEADYQQAMVAVLGNVATIDKLVERNTAAMAADLAQLRIDAANVFAAMGFDVAGASLTDELLALIERQRAIVEAITPAPPQVDRQISLLTAIATNTAATASALGAQAAQVPYYTTSGGGDGDGYQYGTAYVPRTGYALLHAGEQVVPAGERGGVVIQFGDINVSGTGDPRATAQAVADAIERSLRTPRLRAVVQAVAKGR